MTDYSELKRLAENAAEQRKNWEDAGKPWPIWNSCMYEMHSAVTPDVVLGLIAENEALRDGTNFRAIQSLRQDCESLRKDTALGRVAIKFIDRLCDPSGSDPLEKIVEEYTAAFREAMSKEG